MFTNAAKVLLSKCGNIASHAKRPTLSGQSAAKFLVSRAAVDLGHKLSPLMMTEKWLKP